MRINPTYAELGNIFDRKSVFFVPKYQRGYAWDDDAVGDFLTDLEACYHRRKKNEPREHFFGGVLSIRGDIPGVANGTRYELVDGQQRITTLCLLAHALSLVFDSLKKSDKGMSNELKKRVKLQSDKIKESFVAHPQVVNRQTESVSVVTLSQKDKSFFESLVQGRKLHPKIDSHHKLLKAFENIKNKIQVFLQGKLSTEEILEVLETLQEVLFIDFSVLHMVADNKTDAYRLFQVINDRGVLLSDGDLLRVKTLEMLEDYPSQQLEVESIWDEILSDKPSKTLEFLNWIYESYAYRRAKTGSLSDEFIKHFFEDTLDGCDSEESADACLATLQKIQADILKCRKLVAGEWPFPHARPILAWHRSRLKTLCVDLGHTLCIPVLLAVSDLDHKKFSQIVLMIERSFFRYKVICNQHVTPLKSLYQNECSSIRAAGSSYNVSVMRAHLNTLLDERSPITAFEHGVRAITYQAKTGGNKDLKYLLLALESYSQWVDSGASGFPKAMEANIIIDFNDSSIEHIYPRNADAPDKLTGLEPLKNMIGNLTILDPDINSSAGNEPFLAKKEVFKQSVFKLNQHIASLKKWEKEEHDKRLEDLIGSARQIFRA